ncbi:MAG: adenylyltransferase/cytidyltransferase family protein [Candidatus Aminicenantales bacterium]
MKEVLVTGPFDDLRARDVRFLEEAAKFGRVQAGLWTDDLFLAREKKPPKFAFAERLYMLQAIRYVSQVSAVGEFPPTADHGPGQTPAPGIWAVDEAGDSPETKALSEEGGLELRIITAAALKGFPPLPALEVDARPESKRVVVTGCYDWFHSGHVRFFEEAAAFGDLYVGVGSDANLRRLKRDGHPLFPEAERAYMVQSVRHVKRAFIATGQGWMDAEPEIATIKPHYYVVNEDGDRPEKREFCRQAGIEYVVLTRTPKPGLPRRDSTRLRGF